MESVTFKAELINALLNYLAGRPYAEVVNLIAAIQEAAKLEMNQTAQE